MRRFLDYYRQFDELSPREVSEELRARREEERRRAPVQQGELDLSGEGWHEPPHPEVVNAATFALRRAVNDYPYPTAAPLRAALGAAHGVDPERVVAGHGAGELLRAALRAIVGRGQVRIAWPGWGPLPRLAAEAGATPAPVDPAALLAHPQGTWADGRARAIVLGRPADPTGAVIPLADVRELARRLSPDTWLVLDEALAGFLPDGEDAILDAPHVLHVRSFSKAHAMAGFRVGYAVVPSGEEELAAALAPAGGVGAAAQAGALWAVESGAEIVRRRRAQAERERGRLAEALARGPVSFPPGHGPYVWLASEQHDGRELAERLAARRVYVAPGAAWGDDRHVRVTLRDAQATDRLVAALPR